MKVEGKTKSGFEYSIKESALNNFELVDALAEVDENPLLMSKVLNMLLGKEQKKKLFDHIRKEDGTVPFELVEKELVEIFQSNQDIKN